MTPRAVRPLPEMPPRAVIYLRQSTFKEESISLELQEIACRDYCDRMGYHVVRVEADPGMTGRTWKRPAVQRTMDAIEHGDADVIVLWKWSRLSRSRKDWALAIDRTDLAGGRIESATEPIDTATASGRFARGVMTEFSAYQSELIGEIWEDVRQRRLNLGLPASGRLPFGWRWVKGQGIEQHPDQAPVVAEMYRRYLAGEGAGMIAQWLNHECIPGPNGNPWTRVRPLTVLDSPIHAGLIPYRGKIYPGAHEPIIPAGTWEAYRAERERRRTRGVKVKSADYLLSSLVRCACGGRMAGKGAVTGGKWYGGYICGNRFVDGHPERAYISARTLEPPIEAWLMEFDTEIDASSDQTVTRSKIDAAHRAINRLEDQLVRLTRERGRDEIPPRAYQRAVAEIESEIESHQAEIARCAAQARAVPSGDELAKLRRAWKFMLMPARNQALRGLIDRIELDEVGAMACIRTVWGDSSIVTL